MDKRKQIEEMAKEIKLIRVEPCEFMTKKGCPFADISCDECTTAQYIFKAGYRKIPEIPKNTVLTADDIAELLTIVAKDTRKETAEKFAARVKMAFYYEFDELIPSIMADKIDEICKEITEGKNE